MREGSFNVKGLPLPNLPGTANNYTTLQRFENNSNKYNIKVDMQFSSRLSSFARFGQRDADLFDQPLLPLPSGGAGNGYTYIRNKQFATGLTFVPSARSLWEFRFAMIRAQGGKNPPALGTESAEKAYGITGLPSDPRVAGGLPTQLVTGFADWGRQATNPQWQYPTVFIPKVSYMILLGRHSLKTGFEMHHIRTEVQDVNPLYGRDEYSGRFTRPFGNSMRNGVQADPLYQVDFSLSKFFTLPWRESRLQLRMEAFNFLNRTNFRAANGTRTSAAFGTITSTYDPRQIQFALKLIF